MILTILLWLGALTVVVAGLTWKLLCYRRVIRVLAGYQHELVDMVTDPKESRVGELEMRVFRLEQRRGMVTIPPTILTAAHDPPDPRWTPSVSPTAEDYL